MQDPYKIPGQQYQKQIIPKSQRKQVGLLQPKALTQLDNATKLVLPKSIKRRKKGSYDAAYAKEGILKAPSSALARRPVGVDMMQATEGDSRSLYRALKRKYTTLEEESSKLVEELEKTDSEAKKLEEEKFALLDELLVLEGLAYNPFPSGGQLQVRNVATFPL